MCIRDRGWVGPLWVEGWSYFHRVPFTREHVQDQRPIGSPYRLLGKAFRRCDPRYLGWLARNALLLGACPGADARSSPPTFGHEGGSGGNGCGTGDGLPAYGVARSCRPLRDARVDLPGPARPCGPAGTSPASSSTRPKPSTPTLRRRGTRPWSRAPARPDSTAPPTPGGCRNSVASAPRTGSC